MKTLIAPSILSCDFSILGEEVLKVEKSGANYLHFDVMDGHFVPNISFGAPVLKCINTKLVKDVHLMISDPSKYCLDFIEAGADIITIHYETLNKGDFDYIYKMVKSHNKKLGICIKPKTEVNEIKEYLAKVDLVLVMSVEPGFGGQKFMDSSLAKIKELNDLRKINSFNYLIEVDGGINEETARLVKDKGADILVAGSYIFKSKDYKKAIDSLR